MDSAEVSLATEKMKPMKIGGCVPTARDMRRSSLAMLLWLLWWLLCGGQDDNPCWKLDGDDNRDGGDGVSRRKTRDRLASV